jgi:hypothetical protein
MDFGEDPPIRRHFDFSFEALVARRPHRLKCGRGTVCHQIPSTKDVIYMVVLLQIIPSFPDSQPQIGVEEFLSLPQFIHALLMQIQINPVSMRIHFNFFDQLS